MGRDLRTQTALIRYDGVRGLQPPTASPGTPPPVPSPPSSPPLSLHPPFRASFPSAHLRTLDTLLQELFTLEGGLPRSPWKKPPPILAGVFTAVNDPRPPPTRLSSVPSSSYSSCILACFTQLSAPSLLGSPEHTVRDLNANGMFFLTDSYLCLISLHIKINQALYVSH